MRLFNTKRWLIAAGFIHLVMGVIVQFFMTDNVVKMAWGEDGVTAHATFYEGLMALFILPHVAVMFAAAFLLSGGTQAKVAGILGGALLINFIGAALYGSGHGYMAEMGTQAAFAPPIILFTGLTLSGVLHWNND